MAMTEIESLEPIDIRKVWRREDRDFTPWLSAPEPLTRLLAECAIDLGSDYSSRTEVRAPGVRRSLDILVETEDGTRVAIENQYAETDHDHLTRALAYAVGLEADVIDPPPTEHGSGSSQPPHFPATPPGPVIDRHRHRCWDARRGPAVGRLVRSAAPLRARRSRTPPPLTGGRRPRAATPSIESVPGPFGCGCRLLTNPTRTGTRLPASRIGSRWRLDSGRRRPRRSGCT